ncbi:MAG: alpha/beta hydrolase fold domain-containing protein [Phycisphaerales bacterium]
MALNRTQKFHAAALLAMCTLATPLTAQQDPPPTDRPADRDTPQGEAPQPETQRRQTQRRNVRARGQDRATALESFRNPEITGEFRFRESSTRVPQDVEQVREITYATRTGEDGTVRELTMNVFFPRQSGDAPLPAIIYIHGGGWSAGAKEMGDGPSAILASGGYVTATISYRFVQEARFPACMEDCKAAVEFFHTHAEELGIDPQRIGVWGHSAGGHLAAWLATTANNNNDDETAAQQDDVACVVDFFGPADLTTLFQGRRGQRYRQQLFGEVEDIEQRLQDASPMHWIDAEDPPVLIVHGERDDLVPISQSVAFAEKLKAAGVEHELVRVPDAGHGFNVPDVHIRTAAFFDKHLGGQAEPRMQALMERLERGRQALEAERQAAQQARREREREERENMQQNTTDDDDDDAGGDSGGGR